MTIQPSSGVVLVDLTGGNFDVPLHEKAHDTTTHGIVVAVAFDGDASLIGKTAFFRGYKDDCRIDDSHDPKLALIEIKDILGYGSPNPSS